MNDRFCAPISTPLGHLLAVVDRSCALLGLDLDARTSRWRNLPPDERRARRVSAALERYFAGELREFALPLAPEGTPFQLRVWAELCRIPYGSTISYAELARRIGEPKAVRAVGAANGANPIAIVVPCHRVIAADGSLGGYGGGLALKARLLAMERSRAPGPRLL